MSSILIALLSGLLFGSGLIVSSMVVPDKVLNFLDLAGAWDPSLALVMAAAIPVAGLAFLVGRRRPAPLFDTGFTLPTARAVDTPLVSGAVLFGIGWGLVGLCPGPALASLGLAVFGLASPGIWIFVAAMVGGMVAHDLLRPARQS